MLIRIQGLLHLLYSAVSMIFWRVFMRISYSCPAHLKFGLTVEQWTDLVNMTGDAIDWLDAHEALYDVWMLVAYAATSCALVQVCSMNILFHSMILHFSWLLTDVIYSDYLTIISCKVSHMGSPERCECASQAP